MPFTSKLASLLRNLFHRNKVETDLDDELQSYLEELIERKIETGLDPLAARREALIEIAGVDQVKQHIRERRVGFTFESWAQDVSYGLRGFQRTPVFFVITVLMLALGIGANTTLFSVFDAAIFRKLPVERPDQLAFLKWESNGWAPKEVHGIWIWEAGYQGASVFSTAAFEKLRESNQTLSEVFATSNFAGPTGVALGTQGGVFEFSRRWVQTELVSGNYFQVLGVRAHIGRTILPDDDVRNAEPVAVISHRYWKKQFNLDPSVLGRIVTFDKSGSPVRIVGVIAPEFHGTWGFGQAPDVYMALSSVTLLTSNWNSDPSVWWLNIMGRMKPGVTFDQVRANFEGIIRGAAVAGSGEKAAEGVRLGVLSGNRGDPESLSPKGDIAPSIAALSAFFNILLWIVCLNVANLLLARAAARQYEIGVRLAIGAGRSRLIRQLLTESALLAICGGALGLLLANWGKNLLTVFLGDDVDLIRIDFHVLAFTLAPSLATAVAFGLVPALQATRLDLNSVVMKNTRTLTRNRSRLAKTLLAGQIALCLVLVVAGGVLFRTLESVFYRDIGFKDANLVIWNVRPPDATTPARPIPVKDAFERMRRVAGLSSVTFWRSRSLPAVGGPTVVTVGPDFFRTIGIPILQGRDFDSIDLNNPLKTAIVNQTLAGRFFDGSPLGKDIPQFQFSSDLPPKIKAEIPEMRGIKIIGVAKDVRLRPGDSSRAIPPIYYVLSGEPDGSRELSIEMRTAGEPQQFLPAIRAAAAEVDPSGRPGGIQTRSQQSQEALVRTFGAQRALVIALNIFGGIALLLVSLGLYGVASYSVARRTAELGIRMALGARQGDISFLIQKEMLGIVGVGAAAGLVAAVPVMMLIRRGIFGLAPNDIATPALGICIVFMVCALAAYIPARRAARVDPMVSLRNE